MANHSEQHREGVPNQPGGHADQDMGEGIYARYAQFVWPKSIASSLAQRFTPFSGERLSLATFVQRRWTGSNSSRSQWLDLQWLQAFTSRPRKVASARPEAASSVPRTSFRHADHSSPAPDTAFRSTAEIAPNSKITPAPANASQATSSSPVSGEPREEYAERDVRGHLSSPVEHSSVVASPISETNSGAKRTPPSPGSSVEGSAISRSATVYSGRPIIRRSLTPRGTEAAHRRNLSGDATSFIPDSIISREHSEERGPLIMRQVAIPASDAHEVSIQRKSAQEPITTSVPALHSTQAANIREHEVEAGAGTPPVATQPVARTANVMNDLQCTAENKHNTVISEYHNSTPATPRLHLKHESTDRRANDPRDGGIPEDHGSSPAPLIQHATQESPISATPPRSSDASVIIQGGAANPSPPVLHLKRDSDSAEGSSISAFDKNSTKRVSEAQQTIVTGLGRESSSGAVPAESSKIHSGPEIEHLHSGAAASGSRNQSVASESSNTSASPVSEPMAASSRTILRSAHRNSAGQEPSFGMSKNASSPAVVQQSVLKYRSHAEPLVWSSHSLPGAFRSTVASNFENKSWAAIPVPGAMAVSPNSGFTHRSPGMITRAAFPQSSASAPAASMPVARQAATDDGGSVNMQLPSLPTASASANFPSFGSSSSGSPPTDIAQLASRVYEMLVRRLASERQRRGR